MKRNIYALLFTLNIHGCLLYFRFCWNFGKFFNRQRVSILMKSIAFRKCKRQQRARVHVELEDRPGLSQSKYVFAVNLVE